MESLSRKSYGKFKVESEWRFHDISGGISLIIRCQFYRVAAFAMLKGHCFFKLSHCSMAPFLLFVQSIDHDA